MSIRKKFKCNPYLVHLDAISSLYKIDLELFQKYASDLELNFEAEKREIEKRFNNATEKIDDEDVKQQMAEVYGEDHHIVDTYFLKYFRYSSIMALHSLLENEVRHYARFMKNSLKINEDIPRGKGIDGYKDYLKNKCDFSYPFRGKEWQRISDLVKIRNCLVHCDGLIFDSSDSEYLEKLPKKYKGISVYNERELRIGNSYLPLAIEYVGDFLKLFEESLFQKFISD